MKKLDTVIKSKANKKTNDTLEQRPPVFVYDRQAAHDYDNMKVSDIIDKDDFSVILNFK